MLLRLRRYAATLLAAPLAACGLLGESAPDPISQERFDELHAAPWTPPSSSMAVFHLGHSLVGRNMPAMLAQLAPDGHRYESQLGWGASMREHWEPDVEIPGYDLENDHPRFRDAYEAVDSGDYDAVVLTESVEIKDAIKYDLSWKYLPLWSTRVWEANPNARVYLYESWHKLDDPEGWLERLDRDRGLYWEGEILRRAHAAEGMDRPVRVIPVGQVFARFVREIESVEGGVGGLMRREDLFKLKDDGSQDPIHFNDIGAYLVALTHYATLYHDSPVGAPYQLKRGDGSPADAPSAAAARRMQEIVWEVVAADPMTGVAPTAAD